MKLPAGSIVQYQPTRRGRERAAELIAEFPESAQTVPKVPHHVELLADFALQPAKKTHLTDLAHRVTGHSLHHPE